MPVDETKKQIQNLISQGRTSEALEILESLTHDAVLLQAEFNTAKKQHSLGLMDFSEWSRVQARINYAAMDLLRSVKTDAAGNAQVEEPAAPGGADATAAKPSSTVYITYSPETEEDHKTARRMKEFLEENGVAVTTNEDMELGANIQDFVASTAKSANFILVVISKNSLMSSWESGEAALDIVLERIAENKVVPVSLDKEVLKPDFYFQSLDFINKKINEYQGYVMSAISAGGDSRAFQSELNRLVNAKNQLALIIEKMKSVRMVSMGSEKGTFEDGMAKILARIKNAKPS